MKIKRKFSNNNEKIFLGLYALFIIVDILDNSLYSVHFFWRVTIIFEMLFLLLLILSRRTFQSYQLAIFVVGLTLFAIAAFSTGREYLIVYALFLINSDLTAFENIVRVSKNSSIITTLVVLLSSIVGIIPNMRFQERMRTAYGFGFSYYSALPFIVFFIMLMDFYCNNSNNRKNTLSKYFLWGIIQYIVYYFSTLRLTLYLSIISIGLFFIVDKVKGLKLNKKFFVFGSIILFPLGACICAYVMYMYNASNVIWLTFNRFLNNRLYLSHLGLQRYPLKLFGQKIVTNTVIKNGYVQTSNFFYIDSGFVYSLLGYGVVFTVFLIIMYSYIMYSACKKNQKAIFIWGVMVCIFSLVNNTWVSITYNPLLFAFPLMIRESLRKNKVIKVVKKENYYEKL